MSCVLCKLRYLFMLNLLCLYHLDTEEEGNNANNAEIEGKSNKKGENGKLTPLFHLKIDCNTKICRKNYRKISEKSGPGPARPAKKYKILGPARPAWSITSQKARFCGPGRAGPGRACLFHTAN